MEVWFLEWSCMCPQSLQLCLTLWYCGPQPTRLLCLWDFPSKNTGVGCHALLQGSSQPRDWISVSCTYCIAVRFFTTELPGKPWSEVKGDQNSLIRELMVFFRKTFNVNNNVQQRVYIAGLRLVFIERPTCMVGCWSVSGNLGLRMILNIL